MVQNPYKRLQFWDKLLKYFMISVILFKMSKHSDFHLIFFQIEGAWQYFAVVTKLMKNFKSLYGFGGRFLKIRDVCMDFEPYFKVNNLVSVHPKSIILGQMINLDMLFHVLVSVYRLVKIWNSPQFPVEFSNGRYIPPYKSSLPCRGVTCFRELAESWGVWIVVLICRIQLL